ncbi:MAG: hypothetical protein Q4C80_05785 [Bacillota bacterium]|nr:hypothetical protein [Bacillota bacterium]
MNEAKLSKSRKGRKKLEALENQIERVAGEFDNRYMHTREMKYLKENIRWSRTSKLVFLLGQRTVYFRWKGLRDYGFIRECAQWLEVRGIDEPSPEQVIDMMDAVLPDELCERLSEELKTLELA